MKLSIPVAAALIALSAVGCSRQNGAEPSGVVSSTTSVVVLDEANFGSQIQSGVVLVDFWATWCGPCKMQGPIVEQVAKQVEGKAKVAKLDVDAAPKAAGKFNIQSIPTLVIFKDGKAVKSFVGVTPRGVESSASWTASATLTPTRASWM